MKSSVKTSPIHATSNHHANAKRSTPQRRARSKRRSPSEGAPILCKQPRYKQTNASKKTNTDRHQMGCAQINVISNGTFTPSPSSIVTFPGAYNLSDPYVLSPRLKFKMLITSSGIDLNIWSSTKAGVADIDGAEYIIPGPAPITC